MGLCSLAVYGWTAQGEGTRPPALMREVRNAGLEAVRPTMQLNTVEETTSYFFVSMIGCPFQEVPIPFIAAFKII